jgi:hypothetical protein
LGERGSKARGEQSEDEEELHGWEFSLNWVNLRQGFTVSPNLCKRKPQGQ